MDSVHDLWQSYHSAVRAKNLDLAKRILNTLKNRTVSAPPTITRNNRTCAKCRRSLTRG